LASVESEFREAEEAAHDMLALSEAILRLPAPNRRRLVFQALALAERGPRAVGSARRGRPAGPVAKATAGSGVFRSSGPRRTVASLQAQANALHAEVQRSGGRGIEALAKALGTSTHVLALPMKMLLDEGRVTRTGRLRGTKYAAGKSGSAPAAKKAKRGRKKKA
jgi:hypothetical protein